MITQGEWEAITTAYGFCVLAGPKCKSVAERYFDRKPTKAELQELHDNSRLVAAAPKLLAACKLFMKAINIEEDLELSLRTAIALSLPAKAVDQAIAKTKTNKTLTEKGITR